MKVKEYIEDEEFTLENLKQRLKEIKFKIFKFGLRAEEEFLEKYIKLKEEFILKLKK